jgi:predicted nucleic acid-binding protein
VSAVNIAEFFAGLRPAERSRWAAFFGELRYWGVTPQVAVRAGIYRYDYARQGRTILLPDALVAATAVEEGAILVTNNVKDFPMPELSLLRLPD